MITAEELAKEIRVHPNWWYSPEKLAAHLLPFIQSRAARVQGASDGPLSSRLRPDVECAPWVIEEVKKLERRLATPQPPKPAGAVPNRIVVLKYPLQSDETMAKERIYAEGWNTCHAVFMAYIAECEAAGRADAVPQKERPDFIAGYDAGMADAKRMQEACEAEPAARAQVVAPEIDAVYKWCAARSLFGAEVDEVYDDDIVAALDDYEGALIEAAELAVNQLPKSVRLYSKKELEACESSASAVARAKAFDEVREMCAPLGYESFREAFDALGKLQASPAHAGAGAEALDKRDIQALARCEREIMSMMDDADDFGFDEMALGALDTALESIRMRRLAGGKA